MPELRRRKNTARRRHGHVWVWLRTPIRVYQCSTCGHLRRFSQLAKGRARKSKSGLPFGVTRERSGVFSARIWDGRRVCYLGSFLTVELAHAAAISAKRALHA